MKDSEKKLLLPERAGSARSGAYGSVSSQDGSHQSYDTSPTPQKTLGLLSFCQTFDYVLLAIGTLASIVHGAGFPLLSILLGGMTTVFLRAQNSPFSVSANDGSAALPPISQDEFNADVVEYTIYYLILGIAMFVTSYVQIACFEIFAERIVQALRQNYLKSLLRQEIAWFDNTQTGSLTTRLNDDLERVREGIGDKLSLFIQMMAAFAAGFVVGFIYNWQMALVMCAFTPLLAFTNSWMGKFTASRVQMEQEKYAIAGSIAEEAFGSMRTVLAFNGQFRELNRYEKALEDGRKTGLVKYMYMAVGFTVTFMIMYISYGVAFWFGSLLIVWDPSFDRGTVFTVFFAVMTGSTSLGAALPHLTAVSMGRGAGRYVLGVINSIPYIDPYSKRGAVIRKPKGAIEFSGVHFLYLSRPDTKVLKGINFKVEPGQKVALVGASGCGKSTCLNLVLRFYDPTQGTITIDGYDLREMNVAKLRDFIGVVSQEPVLFDGTLEENVMLGNDNATREDVINCCKMANAYDFIQKLPEGMYTRVGERGVQLSGGQKQRIAIARALIKNPKVLLLDEATSALDTESEALVQRSLERAQENRTTLIVAHRLSTIKNVDKIYVFQEGEIVEEGTHSDLIEAKGLFYEMVQNQQIHQEAERQTLGAIKEHSNESDASESERSSQRPTLVRKISQRKTSVATSQQGASKKKLSTASSAISRSSTATIYELQKECEQRQLTPTPISKIMAMNKENWGWLLLGLTGCCISGLVMPFFALVYSQIISVFSEPVEQLQKDALFWAAMFVVIGLVNGLGFFTSANCLGQCGEALTKKLRYEAFKNLMRQDIGFYDDKRHNTGKLSTRFSTDAPNVRYVFTRLPVLFSSIVTLIGAIVIGFVYGWKLALILLAIVPLILASGYFELQMKFGKQMRDTELLEEAGKIASEAVENIRTIAGLNKQLVFHYKYMMHLVEPFYTNVRQAHVYGGVFAFSQSIMFFMYAIAFYLGSVFVNDQSMEPVAVYRVFFAIAFCGQSVGQISSFIPDVVKARLAASLLFHLIEFPTAIDSLDTKGKKIIVKGNVQFKSVDFCYPTRPQNKVLHGMNVQVEEGKSLALVGQSGCGKSTVMSLLERFYKPKRGSITVDNTPIEEMNIHSLRDQVCIVSQEPTLFDCSIKDNITYGMRTPVTMEAIHRACELANIHDFIMTLPQRYDTRVGERGTQLSGGQKQRIAIARAVIRDPAVLLLDEATSALDSESEKIVQDALEKVRKGRTCIIIAHRLSTVQNADQIAVIKDGKVVEKGTHFELLNRPEGIYRHLCSTQILDDRHLE